MGGAINRGSTIRKLPKMVAAVFLMLNVVGCATLNDEPVRSSQIEAEVRDAFKELVAASKALDAKRYFECFDREKFTGLSANGKVWHSIKDLENIVIPGFLAVDKINSLAFFNVKITVINPSTAILANEFKETVLLKNGSTITQSGGGTQVWSKSGKSWKLVSVSASEASQ